MVDLYLVLLFYVDKLNFPNWMNSLSNLIYEFLIEGILNTDKKL